MDATIARPTAGRQPAWIASLGVGAATVVFILMVRFGDVSNFTNDAAQYWSVTTNLLAGRGLVTSAIYYEVQAALGLPAPQTIWPNGLPLLAAGVARATGLDAARAIIVVNAISHVATAGLLAWIAWRLRGSHVVAVVAGLAYLLFAKALLVAMSGVAEPPYMLALVGSLAYVVKAFDGRNPPSTVSFLAAATSVGIACTFRYPAIFFVAPLGLTAWVAFAAREVWWRAFLRAAIVCAPAVVIFAALVARNLALTGHVSGLQAQGQARLFADFLFQARWAIIGLFSLHGLVPVLAMLAVFSAFAIDLIRRWRGAGVTWLPEHPLQRTVLLYALTGAFLSKSIIVLFAARSTFYSLEERYFLPALVFGVVACLAFWPRQSVEQSRAVQHWLAPAAAILAIAVQTHNVVTRWSQDTLPAALGRALMERTNGASLADRLKDETPQDRPIASNQSQLLHLLLGRPTFGVPERRLTPRPWAPADVVSAIQRANAHHLVVFRRLPLGERDGSSDFVWQLDSAGHPDLTLVLRTDDISLYRVRTLP